MEVAEHEHLVEHVPVEVADDPVEVVAGLLEPLEVLQVPVALGDHDLDQRDALDELGRQDARRRVVAVHAGDSLVPVALRVLAEQDGLAGLDEVVDLVGGPARELVDDVAALGPAEQPRPVEQPRHAVHEVDVGLEGLADVRPLDLDRDDVAVVEAGPVDLPDRRRGERLVLEGREGDLGLGAELATDDLADLVVAERRDLVEQPEQLVAVGDRQDVVAQGQHLAELHPRPAETLEGEAESDGSGVVVGAREVQGGRDEQAEEHGDDVPDPQRVPEQGPHAAVGRTLGRPSVRRCAATASDRPVSRRRRRTRRGRAGSASPSLPPTRDRP